MISNRCKSCGIELSHGARPGIESICTSCWELGYSVMKGDINEVERWDDGIDVSPRKRVKWF
jgi:hypothetical protein